ncbi:hypothetical protein RUND412_003117 [Rhizina undulata]
MPHAIEPEETTQQNDTGSRNRRPAQQNLYLRINNNATWRLHSDDGLDGPLPDTESSYDTQSYLNGRLSSSASHGNSSFTGTLDGPLLEQDQESFDQYPTPTDSYGLYETQSSINGHIPSSLSQENSSITGTLDGPLPGPDGREETHAIRPRSSSPNFVPYGIDRFMATDRDDPWSALDRVQNNYSNRQPVQLFSLSRVDRSVTDESNDYGRTNPGDSVGTDSETLRAGSVRE